MLKKSTVLFIMTLLAIGLLSGCSDLASATPEDIVKEFTKAFAHRDKDKLLQLILEPDRYADKFNEMTGSDNPGTVEFTRISARSKDVPIGKYVIVDCLIKGDKESWQIYLKNTDQGFKVDPGRSFGINAVSFTQFKIEKTAAKLYLNAKLDDYYNFEFRNTSDKYYSLAIYDTNGAYTSLHAYLPKNNPDAKKIYDTLKDGKSHRMALSLMYSIPMLRDEGTDGVIVAEVRSIDNWLDVPASDRAVGS